MNLRLLVVNASVIEKLAHIGITASPVGDSGNSIRVDQMCEFTSAPHLWMYHRGKDRSVPGMDLREADNGRVHVDITHPCRADCAVRSNVTAADLGNPTSNLAEAVGSWFLEIARARKIARSHLLRRDIAYAQFGGDKSGWYSSNAICIPLEHDPSSWSVRTYDPDLKDRITPRSRTTSWSAQLVVQQPQFDQVFAMLNQFPRSGSRFDIESAVATYTSNRFDTAYPDYPEHADPVRFLREIHWSEEIMRIPVPVFPTIAKRYPGIRSKFEDIKKTIANHES